MTEAHNVFAFRIMNNLYNLRNPFRNSELGRILNLYANNQRGRKSETYSLYYSCTY